jgi:hypothetical protein
MDFDNESKEYQEIIINEFKYELEEVFKLWYRNKTN